MHKLIRIFVILLLYNSCLHSQKYLNEGGVIFNDRWGDLFTGNVTSIDLNGGKAYKIEKKLIVEAEMTWLATDVRGYIFTIHDLNEVFIRINYLHIPEKDSAVLRVDFIKDGKEYFLTFNKNEFSRYKWHKFKVTLDPVRKKFGLDIGEKKLTCNYFKDFGPDVNVTFGLPFQGTSLRQELAYIAVRNISLFADDKSEYYPLYEVEGATARDTKSGNYANVKNGIWLNKLRYEPKEEEVFMTQAYRKNYRELFNNDRAGFFGDTLYIFEDKILRLLSLRDMRTYVEKVSTMIHPASQFINFENTFAATYCGGESQISVFDLQKRVWSKIDTSGQYEQGHYRSAIIYNSLAKEFWSYGGYGYYMFKDHIRKYVPESGKWVILPEKAHSKYFFAPGNSFFMQGNNYLYIVGAEGSEDGRQPLDGNTFYNDIIRLDLRDTTFSRISTMNFDNRNWYIAGLMPYYNDDELIVLSMTRSANIEQSKAARLGFYHLTTSTGKVKLLNSRKILGYHGSRTAPYSESYSEAVKKVTFSSEREEIYFLTSIYDSTGQSRIILNVMKTPLMTQEEFEELRALSGYRPNDIAGAIYFVVFGGAGFFISGFILMKYARKKRVKRTVSNPETTSVISPERSTVVIKQKDMTRNFIRLFGEFQILNRNGDNVASQMTAKNKQVFLYILLNSIGSGTSVKRGVTSEQLGEVFWEDLPAASIKNNRNVNIKRIREAIADTDGLELVYQNQHFYFEVSEELGIDHLMIQSLTGKDEFENFSSEEFSLFLSIIEKGRFLDGLSHEWLDFYQDKINDKILYNLNACFDEIIKNKDVNLKIRIAALILTYDELNERAFNFMLKHQINQRNIRSAHSAYEKFSRKFREETGKAYNLKFEDFLSDETNLKI